MVETDPAESFRRSVDVVENPGDLQMTSKPSVGKSMPSSVGDRKASIPAPLYPIVKTAPQAMPARGEQRLQTSSIATSHRVATELRSREPGPLKSTAVAHGAAVARPTVSGPKGIPPVAPPNSIDMSTYPHGRGGMAGVSMPPAAPGPAVAARSAGSAAGRPVASRMPAST